MAAPFRLVMRSGPRAGQVIPLEKAEFFIGRDTSNDLVLEDPEVSRRHAHLFTQGPSYAIEDLGSTNGTAVNGQRLTGPYVLRPGDLITLGEQTNLVFEGVTADQAATIAALPVRDEPGRSIPPPPQPAPRPAPPPQGAQAVTPPSEPPVRYPQPSYPPPAPPPASRAPAGDYVPPQPYPAQAYEAPVEVIAQRRQLSPVVIALLVLIGCLLIACILFAIIDTLNLYCTLFPGIVNLLVPGYCP